MENTVDTKVQLALITSIAGVFSLLIKMAHTKYKARKLENEKRLKEIKLAESKILTADESPVFAYLDTLRMDILYSFKVSHDVSEWEAKENTFKDIMINKIDIWKELLSELVESVKCAGNCDECKVSLVESRKLHLAILAKGISKYTNYYVGKDYTENQVKALNICMPKFNEVHTPNTELVTDMIALTHTPAKYFKKFCPVLAMGFILSAYNQAFLHMIHDISSTIDNMNGDLKGIRFERRSYA